jgi:valyl-tRNA synthetase
VFFRVQSENEAALFESQAPTMVTLTKGCKSVQIVRELTDVPEGCGSAVLTPTVAAYVLVRGQIDLDVEIGKCEKKLDLAQMGLAKIHKVESQADYAVTVPSDVRLINEDKARRANAVLCACRD